MNVIDDETDNEKLKKKKSKLSDDLEITKEKILTSHENSKDLEQTFITFSNSNVVNNCLKELPRIGTF